MGQQDLKIHELVGKVERGEIRLPEMQRQYVWQASRVRDLLDSLYRGYPSGTILTWETNESVPTRDFAVSQGVAPTQSYQLLLDGQQRLTSLSAILRGEPIQVRGRKRPIDVLFNLEHPDALEVVTEVFEHDEDEEGVDTEEVADATEDDLMKRFNKMAFIVSTNKLASLPQWVSVTEVFKSTSDKPFLSKAGVTTMDDPRYDKYTERLKKLRDIKEYSYRVHILEREKSYEEVTEIFVRVNSLGAKLRGSDLALAQITATWRNSLAIFQEFQEECKTHGFDLDLSLYIKTMVAFATGQSRFKSVSNIALEELQDSWKDTCKAMRFAINFMRSNADIDSPVLLSSPFIIITLAYYAYFMKYHLAPSEERQLRYWLLVANAKARYSRGSSESFLDQDIAAIRKGLGLSSLISNLSSQVGRLDIQAVDLENRNSRSAYFKTMFLVFKKDQAMDWRDQLVISLAHAGSQHTLQFHHIFPQDVLRKANFSLQMINDICNLAFISGKTNRKISNKPPLQYLPELIDKIGNAALIKQCIPIDRSLWEIERYAEFLKMRREEIAERLNAFLGHHAIE
jgi:hypothetical protein